MPDIGFFGQIGAFRFHIAQNKNTTGQNHSNQLNVIVNIPLDPCNMLLHGVPVNLDGKVCL